MMLGRQISLHKYNGYQFRNEIITIISNDYNGPYISATLKSTNPDAGGLSECNQIWFYKCRVDSFAEAFDKLTSEVSKAKIKYPDIEFFRWVRIPEEYPSELIKKWHRLDQNQKVKMVKEGCQWKVKTINLYEIYSGGSWAISNYPPWSQ